MIENFTELIWGRNPVFEVLRGKRTVHKIYATIEAINFLRSAAHKAGVHIPVRIEERDKQFLERKVHRGDHQGIVAEVSAFQYTPLIEVFKEARFLIFADGITDEQNLGAIARTALLCSADALIVPTKNSARISPVTTHVSAGATEHLPICVEESLTHALQLAAERDFTICALTSEGEENKSLAEVPITEKMALIVGSEGVGISGKLLAKTHFRVKIPQNPTLDSFNASVACGIASWFLAWRMSLL